MSLMSKTINRQTLQSSVLKYFLHEEFNFEQGLIKAGSQVNSAALADIGAVLGQITLGAASVAAKSGGNTGGGALTLDVTTPILDLAEAGIYTVRCVVPTGSEAVIHKGIFEVRNPSGRVLGEVEVGATFANQIKFSIAYATADYVVGDGFDVTIAAGSGKYVPHDAAALDGSQKAAAIVARAVTIDASNDTPAALLVRGPAVVVSDALIWKTGIAASAKASAVAVLQALGIVSRAL
jgi:hypothetical protein